MPGIRGAPSLQTISEMYFAFSAVSVLVAVFVLVASGNTHSTGGTLVLWVLAFAFFTGGLVLAKKGIASRKSK